MRGVLLPSAVFAVLLFVGYLLLSGAAVWVSIVKALVIALVFAIVQLWLVRRRARRQDGESSHG